MSVHSCKNISLLHSTIEFMMLSGADLNDLNVDLKQTWNNRSLLVSSNYLVFNNIFSHFGRWIYTYQPGVHIGLGVGTVVRNNLFHSAYHSALLFSGNSHRIEMNEFRNVVTMGYDCGAIYSGRDLSSRGTTIVHNYFHHMNLKSPCNAETSCIRAAIYIDDFQSDVLIVGNIFYKVMTSIFTNQGADFIFQNNMFVKVGTTIRQDGAKKYNGFGSKKMSMYLYTGLQAVPFQDRLWSIQYPELKNRFSNWKNGTSSPPLGTNEPLNNLYAMNCVVNATGPVHVPGEPMDHFHNFTLNAKGMFSLPAPYYTENCSNTSTWFNILNSNRLLRHPGFVNERSVGKNDTMNFTLKDDSVLWKLGWQKIPQDGIGVDW